MEQPRKILIASFYFPPDAAVGGLRSAKFARYLPEFGWKPYVITARDEYRDQGLDQSRLVGLEQVPITRTRRFPSFQTVFLSLRAVLRGSKTSPPAAGAPRPVAASPASGGETLTDRIKRYVASLIVLLPDPKKEWALFAAMVAVRQIRAERIGCVLTSAPPFSVHMIGLIAKLGTGVRWIADFRDPWVEMIPERTPLSRSRLSDALERWMEGTVVRRADRVLTTTDRLRQSLMRRYPALPPEKFVYLPNSIDTDRFRVSEPIEKYGPLTITYAGTLYFDRSPEPVFRAVGELLQTGRIQESDVRIKLLGHCKTMNGRETQAVAREYGLEQVVEVIPPVPYAEAVRIMQRSHLLLTIAPRRHALVVGAKLFDYLGSGSKILALADPGATTDLVAQTNSGRSFSTADVDGLREYLGDLIVNRASRSFTNDVAAFQQLDVRHLTERLAAEASDARPAAVDRTAVTTV